jgi:hypothetical protein
MNMTEQLDQLHLARMLREYGIDWVLNLIGHELALQLPHPQYPQPGTITDVRRG